MKQNSLANHVKPFAGAALFSIAVQTAFALSADWPEIEVPDKAELSVVGENLAVGDLPVRIWNLHSWQNLEQTVAYYRGIWVKPPQDLQGTGAPGLVESRNGDWIILSRYENGYLTTVQLQASDRETTRGIVALSRLDQNSAPVQQAYQPLLDPQATIASELYSVDGNKRARTITATTTSSVAHAAITYRNLYRRAGWTEVTSDGVIEGAGGLAMMFNKGGEELSLILNTVDGKTGITLVHVRF